MLLLLNKKRIFNTSNFGEEETPSAEPEITTKQKEH